MRLYGQYGLNGMHGLQSGFGSLRSLAPKKKDDGPPVAGYHAWFQARDRSDLIYDSATLVGWKDRGPNRFVGMGAGLMSYIDGKGVRYDSTSNFDTGYMYVPNALNRIRHLFVAVGGWANYAYGGVLCHPTDQNFNILQANDPSRFFTTWAGMTTRINGAVTNEMVENSNAIVSSSGGPDANGAGGDTLMIGAAPGAPRRSYFGGIGEILLYQRQLSDAERNATERWLATRWGVLSKF